MVNLNRVANDKQQFVLPAIPANIATSLAQAIARYKVGFTGPPEAAPEWDAGAQAVAAHEPTSIADLAAKVIIAVHYRDPEIADGDLAIEAPKHPVNRLAVEMELSCIDWLIARLPSPSCARHPLFATFDNLDRLAMALNAGLPSDEELDVHGNAHGAAMLAALALPNTPENLGLRARAIASSCNYNGDVAALDLTELAAHAEGYVGKLVQQVLVCVTACPSPMARHDPALALWERYKTAFTAAAASCRNGEPYHEQHPHGVICDEVDDALPNTRATTLAGVEGKLRNVFLQRNRSDWAQAMVLGNDTPELRRQLDMADVYDRMLWSAIDDLQRLSGEAVR